MFNHLHVHSRYSFLDGLSTPYDLMMAAKTAGCDALALTDHGSISGWIKLAKASEELGVKPIYGIETYFVNNVADKDRKSNHIVLLAKNNNGVKNLFDLLTKAHENFYYTSRIDISMLLDVDDIIVMTACAKGLLSHDNHMRIIKDLKEKFKDDFYLEIMPIDFNEQIDINKKIIELSDSYQPIITNDVHYSNPSLGDTHSFALNMKTGGRISNTVEGLYVKNEEEIFDTIIKKHRYLPKEIVFTAIRNTDIVSQKCNVDFKQSEILLPKLVSDSHTDIYKQAQSSFIVKLLTDDKVGENRELYKDRLDKEMSVIKEKGFSDYFVLVKKICDMARAKDFEMPVGRGSAGGSLLCYLLGITDIDPVKHNLLFERFLNPERTDWPDIDLDFEDNRRNELLEDLKNLFGDDCVANISIFSELKTKSAFKDVSKSSRYGLTDVQANVISKLLSNDFNVAQNMENNLDVSKIIKGIKFWQDIVKHSDNIIGCFRQPGKHAAGIVVSPIPLRQVCVLEKRGGSQIVNWDMDDASYMGLVKVDILGLRTLSIIKEAKESIKNRLGISIDWGKIDVINDDAIIKEFSEGNTVGCMQFESSLQKGLLKRLHPIYNIDTIIDSNALGRPGPLESGMVEKYINRKNFGYIDSNAVFLEYEEKCEELSLLSETYGVIVYQEQIIEILQKIAGYTTAQADIMRRVIAKSKGEDEWNKHQDEFLSGCNKSGLSELGAKQLFDDLKHYSKYSFNRSHAASYTITAMRQMWLKKYYPLDYMCALFNQTNEQEKLMSFVSECRRLNIPISGLSINLSDVKFTIKNDTLVPGIGHIKGIGPKTIQHIVNNRKGQYHNIKDFKIKNPKSLVNKANLKNLAIAGAFDEFKINPKQFINNIDVINDIGITSDIPDIIYNTDNMYDEEELSRLRSDVLPGIFFPNSDIGLNIDTNKLEVLSQIIRNCDVCPLFNSYKTPVPFTYTNESKIMVVGGFPSKEELATGKMFTSTKYSHFWKSFLLRLNLTEKDLYRTHIFKCRPLDDKLPDQIPLDCYRYLNKEIEILKPNIIVVLGKIPVHYFTGRYGGILNKNAKLEAYKVVGRLRNIFWMINPAAIPFSPVNLVYWNEAIKHLSEIIP